MSRLDGAGTNIDASMLHERMLFTRFIKLWRSRRICGEIIRTFAAVFGRIRYNVADYVVDTGIHFGRFARLL